MDTVNNRFGDYKVTFGSLVMPKRKALTSSHLPGGQRV